MNSKPTFTIKGRVLAGAIVLSQALYLSPNMVLAADSTVRLAGQAVMTNVSGSGAASPEKRAETVQQNLDNALVASKDRSPAAVNITYVKGLPVITLGGYQVITVDGDSAKAAGTSPAVLAERWADSLRNSLRDQNSVQSYVSHLTGEYSNTAAPPIASAPPQSEMYAGNTQYQGPPPQQYNGQANFNNNAPGGGYNGYGGQAAYGGQPQGGYAGQTGYNPPPRGYRSGRVVFAPAGLVLNATLTTSISSQVAKSGDVIQANISQPIIVGDSQIPVGSVLLGQVTESKEGRRLGLAGALAIEFNRLRTPDGTETPISAHMVGGVGKYDENDNGQMRGETWKRKTVQAGVRGAAGAGLGAALGTAVGAIAGGGRGAGRGAWSGTAIGGGVGLASSLLLRTGRDVTIQSGTPVQVQLDAPVSIAGGGAGPYVGAY